eukprot:3059960-Prymnesium_polylepis.1
MTSADGDMSPPDGMLRQGRRRRASSAEAPTEVPASPSNRRQDGTTPATEAGEGRAHGRPRNSSAAAL